MVAGDDIQWLLEAFEKGHWLQYAFENIILY